MPSITLFLLLLRGLDPNSHMTEVGRKLVFETMMIVLLKHEQERTTNEIWGVSMQIQKEPEPVEEVELQPGKKGKKKQPPKEDPYKVNIEDDNLYLRMVEPIVYVYNRKEQKPELRYYAQETLVVMVLACKFLDNNLLMEAIFECSMGEKFRKQIYDRFCDRLEQRKHASLIRSLENICSL